MDDIKIINIKKEILSDNFDVAENIRTQLKQNNVFMLNLMGSPGAGKTSLLLSTIKCLKEKYKMIVVEGDIESKVDSEKIMAEGVNAVQLNTGGACHLDAPMIELALKDVDLNNLDIVFIENIGNLVCPAEFDTGASKKAMILSVPEGDDKILKYPLMFTESDALIINKIDCMPYFDFNANLLKERVKKINPKIEIFEVSSKTNEGVENWCEWIKMKREI